MMGTISEELGVIFLRSKTWWDAASPAVRDEWITNLTIEAAETRDDVVKVFPESIWFEAGPVASISEYTEGMNLSDADDLVAIRATVMAVRDREIV